MTDEEYELVEATPSSDDYRRLRIVAGLSPKSAEAAATGLPNTIYAVIIRKDDEVIGMGRIIGDRGLRFQIVDVAVDPAHQKRGLGKRIVGALVEYLHKTVLPGAGAYVSLIADGEAHHLSTHSTASDPPHHVPSECTCTSNKRTGDH